MKKITFIITFLVIIFACQNGINPSSSENIELKDCLGVNLYELLDQSEKLFDQNLSNHFSLSTELDNREAYRRYLKLWQEEKYTEVGLDIVVDSEIEREIIFGHEIKQIFEYSQILGDTIFLFDPIAGEKVLNEIVFNYVGKFAECISESRNQFVNEYLESKELVGDLKLSILAQSLLNQVKKEDLFDNEIIKKIVVVEFFLRPMIKENWKK